MKLFLDIAASR